MKHAFQVLSFFVVAALFSCSGPAYKMRQFPENGYDQTINYQFQAQVHADAEGRCRKLVVRVRPLNKVYWKTPPPDRLQLFDDDCTQPVRFERINYLSTNGDGMVRLTGIEVNRFWSEQFRLQDELISWLWREEVM